MQIMANSRLRLHGELCEGQISGETPPLAGKEPFPRLQFHKLHSKALGPVDL